MWTWVQAAGDAPWLAPSIPFPELSDQPISEMRSVVVPGSDGVEVFYRHSYATGAVDVVDVI